MTSPAPLGLTRSRLRRIFGLALPIMAAATSTNVLNLVDAGFVGRFGDVALAGVGLGSYAAWLFTSLLVGLDSGVQALTARRMGEGRRAEAASGLQGALVVVLGVGIPGAAIGVAFAPEILALLDDDPAVRAVGGAYLAARFYGLPFAAANFSFRGFWNGSDRPKVYLATLLTVHASNVVLSYGLVFGALGLPAMGAEGAGWGTSISLALGTAMHLGLGITRARHDGFLTLRGLRATLPRLLRASVPAGVLMFAVSAGFLAFFVIAGQVGTEAVAASNVLINLSLAVTLPGIGMGLAGATLVGQSLGTGDRDDARRWGWQVTVLGAGIMALAGLVLALGAETWLSVFIVESPETLAMAVLPLVVIGLSEGLEGLGVVLMNLLMNTGDGFAVLRINLLCQWVVFLPAAWLVAVHLGGGLLALWVAMCAFRVLLSAAMILRFRGGGWAHVKV